MKDDKTSLNYKVFAVMSKHMDVSPSNPSYTVENIFHWEWLDTLFVIHLAVKEPISIIYHNTFGNRLPIGGYILLRS